jgi:type II restriction/modification system DNA methylase subunit YeeA
VGEGYVTSLREIYADRIPGKSDFVCYWFVKAAECVQVSNYVRAGLVATNSISGGNNLPTLRFVSERSAIFEAWNDEPWIVEGAAVRVALICFTSPGSNDLTKTDEAGSARTLIENRNVSFIGTQKNGPFDVPGELARSWLKLPVNPNGKSNADVLRPWTNGSGIARHNEDRWIIDFGVEMSQASASLFEAPFEHVVKFVRPTRLNLRRQWHRTKW